MRHWFLIGLALLGCAFVWAADYRPKPGETVMKLTVDRRGDVFVLLYTDKAPNTTAQIIGLVGKGFYDGQRFFRVVKEPRPFLVQVGDPQSRKLEPGDSKLGSGGSGKKIAYEDSGFHNEEGSVGLATLPQDRDSGDSQFYILLAPAKFLDGNYTVFGKVVQGMDVVKKVELGDKLSAAKILRG